MRIIEDFHVVTPHERAHCVGDLYDGVDDGMVNNSEAEPKIIPAQVPTELADITLAHEGDQFQAHKMMAEPPDTAAPNPLEPILQNITEVDHKAGKNSKATPEVIFDKAPLECADVASAEDDDQFKAHKSEPPDTVTQNPLGSNSAPIFKKKFLQMINLFKVTTQKDNVPVVKNLWNKSGKPTDHDGQQKLPSPGQVLGY